MEDKPDTHHPSSAIETFQRTEKPKSVKGLIRRRRRMRFQKVGQKDKAEDGGGGQDEEVEKKIMELQRIVPGGEWVGIENLFEQTANYILALQCQVNAMNSFLEAPEMEKRKLGG